MDDEQQQDQQDQREADQQDQRNDSDDADAALGDAGKAAIKAERDARRKAEREAAALQKRVKAFEDALRGRDDQRIYHYAAIGKRWSECGRILLFGAW